MLYFCCWKNNPGWLSNYSSMFIILMVRVKVMVFNATFNTILVISWMSVLLVEETEVPRENLWPAASLWQTLSHNVVSDWWIMFEICIIFCILLIYKFLHRKLEKMQHSMRKYKNYELRMSDYKKNHNKQPHSLENLLNGSSKRSTELR